MTTWIILIAIAYLVGSIPFGVMIGRMHGVDIREHGSKNIGATNVGRILGRKWGRLCFALDCLKGALPVLAAGFVEDVINRPPAQLTMAQLWLWLAVAAATVLGHMFSIYLGFRGGKGVATTFGALAAMWPLLTLPAFASLVVWYAVLRLTKYVSLASMCAAVSMPVSYLVSEIPQTGENAMEHLLHSSPPLIVTSVLAVMMLVKHRSNIGRLRRGEEPRAGGRARRGGVVNADGDSHTT
jgi:glycerol-3-phosphate acyltransferase PlsY